MTDSKSATQRSRFLSRLLRDQTGNTIAIMAAAVIPVIGLVGGAVDMSRIYLVKTRLQAACDTGALMGRKVMSSGAWAANSNLANTRAVQMFDANFELGAYGTTSRTRTFTEASGAVSGTATATLPMTLMKALGQGNRTIDVECTSEQRVPNTDVMFVLDVTGSMAWAADSSSSESKISGLKKAVKCFYESLAKQDIADVAPSVCGQTANPSGGTGTATIRFGFVPYAVTANVGRLLPLNYMADSWTYQSREASTTASTGYTPTVAEPGALTETGAPVNQTLTGDYGSWEDFDDNLVIGSDSYDWKVRKTKKVKCDELAIPAEQIRTTTGPHNEISRSPDPLVHPQATQTITYRQITTTFNEKYRYDTYTDDDDKKWCILQYAQKNTNRNTKTFTGTSDVTWAQTTTFNGWTYKPTVLNVSSLKDTSNNAWRNHATLPLGDDGAMTDIYWPGCVEERKTWRNAATSPANSDWAPIPADALDMDVDTPPTIGNPDTLWKPILPDAVWIREDDDNDYTLSNLTSTDNDTDTVVDGDVGRADDSCPIESKLYQSWDPLAYQTYVNRLSTGGNTYHDVGLIWGARLMSPTGMYSSITANADEVIDRHMIFMTDGDTNTEVNNYSSYGVSWWDRRQTAAGVEPTDTWEEANLNARTNAICNTIKGKNIHLWVVAYGSGISSATETRLQACASSASHYFRANNVATLVSQFNGIASQISALRLTQ